MNEAEKKAVLISQLPRILKKENIVVIAGSDEMMEACAQIGNAAALIPMMQNALLIAIDSLPDPVLRLKVRQEVSTQIMTKDMTDLVRELQKRGMGSVTDLKEEETMLQGEFETLTGIYPDVLLYEAAEQEYNSGNWASKAEFCECFKADEDGIAQKCRNAANEKWIAEEELIGKLRAENSRLEYENENLRNEIGALHDRVDELSDEISELPVATLEVAEPEITIQSIRTAIQQAYQDAAHDDCKGDQILHMVWGFEYLLQRLGVD